jgi:hypothetical protein
MAGMKMTTHEQLRGLDMLDHWLIMPEDSRYLLSEIGAIREAQQVSNRALTSSVAQTTPARGT